MSLISYWARRLNRLTGHWASFGVRRQPAVACSTASLLLCSTLARRLLIRTPGTVLRPPLGKWPTHGGNFEPRTCKLQPGPSADPATPRVGGGHHPTLSLCRPWPAQLPATLQQTWVEPGSGWEAGAGRAASRAGATGRRWRRRAVGAAGGEQLAATAPTPCWAVLSPSLPCLDGHSGVAVGLGEAGQGWWWAGWAGLGWAGRPVGGASSGGTGAPASSPHNLQTRAATPLAMLGWSL